jgi:hypothetical protein
MPRYTVYFWLSDESAMGWENIAGDAMDAEAQAVTYFEAGGTGPLFGLTRSTVVGPDIPPVGEYSVLVEEIGPERPGD